MLAIGNAGGVIPALHFVFALACFSVVAGFILAKFRKKSMNWRSGGKISVPSQIGLFVLFLVWGIASLDSAFAWGLFDKHEAAVYLVPLGLAFGISFFERVSNSLRR